jgi:hypothetical protein
MATETVINRPAPFVEEIGQKLSEQALGLQQVPVVSTGIAGISRQAGETDAGFKARQDAARAFTLRQQNLAGLAPTVAGQDVLQQTAARLGAESAGIDPTTGQKTGLASFEPFLTRAQQEATLAGGLGTQALGQLGTAGTELTQAGTTLGGIPTGAATSAQIQQFMSPYQSQVIDASLQEFDRNKAIQEQSIRDQQAALGALGSGRAGVQLAEFGTGAARERALLQAGLLQQGFQQAQSARQQDIANRFGISQAQAGLAGQRGALAGATQGLGAFRSGLAGQQAQLGAQTQALQGTDISRLGSLGALNQAQAQAQADATREATRMAAFQPQEELNRFADITTGIMGGMRGSGTSTQNIPNPTPLQTALGLGTTLAGIYGAFKNPGSTDFGRFIK